MRKKSDSNDYEDNAFQVFWNNPPSQKKKDYIPKKSFNQEEKWFLYGSIKEEKQEITKAVSLILILTAVKAFHDWGFHYDSISHLKTYFRSLTLRDCDISWVKYLRC